jgi:tetratricopeptide (TPR) repeat protein
VRNQHSRYYCQTLGEKEAQAGKDQQLARAEIEADLGNLEAAWHWAVQHRLWSHLHQAGYSLYWFYISRLRFQDGLALFQWTVDQLAPDNLAEVEDKDTAWILARVLIWLAEFYSILNQMRRAETLLQQSQALIQSQILAQADIQRDEALWFFTKARVVFPKTEDALGFAQKSLLLARASGDQWQEVQTLRLLGVVFSDQSDVEMAQKSFNNALTLLRSLNDLHLMTMLLLDMGILARNQMDYQHSETLFKESLTLARSQNDQQAIAVALAYLGFLKLFLGEFESGAEYLQQSVELHRKNGDLGNTASNMANLANAYTFAGHLPQARQCIAESLAIAAAFPNILQFVFTTQARINVWMGQYKAAHNNINRLFSVIDETSESRELWFTNSYGPAGWLALVQSDLVIAKENLQKLVDFNRQFNSSESQEWTAIHQATLSRAEWGLGQQATARQHLLEALAVAVKIRAFVTLLHVLPIVPVFLAGEEDTRHKVRAIKIYALANSHPFIANCQFFYDIAGKDVEAVEAELPADVVTAAKARGQALDFWPTAESLLAELTELGWGEEAQRSGGAGEQGRFVKEELVATGGFGEVYRGRDTESGRVVVIKRLRADLVAQQPEALARWERGGELLRRLNHPDSGLLWARVE